MSGGARIMKGLRDALRGNFASVTIEGQTWVRKDCLLSAAPELLAALEALLKDYLAVFEDHPTIEPGWNQENNGLVKQARAAIAKAEGRAP